MTKDEMIADFKRIMFGMDKTTIEIPKELVWKKRKYKVVNQVVEVEHYCGYCIIRSLITLKLPMFYFGVGSRLQDIREMCASMSDNETKAETIGWADSELKTFDILITQTKKIAGERGLTRNE